jgi:PadR family transcriptional regulator PadR
MSNSKSDILQGTLDMLILKAVSLRAMHGYAISQRIQQLSGDVLQVQQGSLYPALHKLENKGWLKAEWGESETGRQAKFYELTKKGRKQLEEESESWTRLAGAVAAIMSTME